MKPISATIKGIIISIIVILASLVNFYTLHLSENGQSQYVILGCYIAGLLWVLISYNTKNKNASFKDHFSEGFKSFIVVALFMAIYTFFFYKYNPQILEKVIVENNELIRKEGNKTPMEIEENAKKIRDIYLPMMLSLNVIKFLFLGALISVITGGFLSQKQKITYISK
jgi:hypothetical protein